MICALYGQQQSLAGKSRRRPRRLTEVASRWRQSFILRTDWGEMQARKVRSRPQILGKQVGKGRIERDKWREDLDWELGYGGKYELAWIFMSREEYRI